MREHDAHGLKRARQGRHGQAFWQSFADVEGERVSSGGDGCVCVRADECVVYKS